MALLKDLTGLSLLFPQMAKVAINSAHLLSLYLRVLPSPRKWKTLENLRQKGCLRTAFPSSDLLSNAKDSDLHFYSVQLVRGSNTQRPARALEKARVSETLQRGVNGAWGGGLA